MSTVVEVKERPILMHARSIRGILEGRKTQTRRIIKGPRSWIAKYPVCEPSMMADPWSVWWHNPKYSRVGVSQDCPYGKPGERLWVREAWARRLDDDHLKAADIPIPARYAWYWADGPGKCCNTGCAGAAGRVRSARFMPRWASRLTLEITNIRVERVQDIHWKDAIDEGVIPKMCCSGIECGCQGQPVDDPRWEFQDLWDETNGKGAWERNDWCWVIDFRKAE